MTSNGTDGTDDVRESEMGMRTMHCMCGCEEYNVRFNFEGDSWLVCAECGRRSDAMRDDTRKRTVSIEGIGETGQTATVDQTGRISVGREYAGETIRYAFEVVDQDK